MKLKSVLIAITAAIGGIYLTSEEGKKAREAISKKKSTFDPIIKSLMKDANEILDGSKEIKSDEIRANINLLTSQAKKILIDIDLEKTMETIQEAIKVSSKKIRTASNEIKLSKKPKPKKKKTVTKKKATDKKKTKTTSK